MFWRQAENVIQSALAQQELLPISTEPTVLHEQGVDFVLHLKNQNSQIKFSPKPKDFNPFLPYEPPMYVADALEEHVCLLNKFPVLSPHLLICSKTFVEQTTPLTLSDFRAWLIGFDADDVLGFYNGGPVAGASQPHRHMQLVKTQIPLLPAIVDGALPFNHRLYRYDKLEPSALYTDYLSGMKALALYDPQQCQPHNLLLGSDWMLIVPRSSNNLDGIFANGINYAGHFLLANHAQIAWLQEFGIMRFLTECATTR